MIKILLFACVLFLLATLSVSVTATTLIQMSLTRMAQAAPLIVRARCTSNYTAWRAGEIWTLTLFQIEQTWKGAPISQATVRLLGGTSGEFTSHVSGVPRFHPGEEVVLFLEPTALGDFSVLAWQQGTFRIQRDARSGEETVTQDTSVFATFNPSTRTFETIGLRRRALAAFQADVTAALQGARAASR